MNSLKTPRSGTEVKYNDNNSSFEKERQMYESYPNSRNNSRNRAVSANQQYLIRKSPILSQNYGNYKHSESVNDKPLLK
jgi:hypothetical protein